MFIFVFICLSFVCYDAACDVNYSRRYTQLSQRRTTTQEEEMASPKKSCVVNLAFLFVFVSISASVAADSSPDRTKTVEFNVKPGGVVHSFTEGIVSVCVNSSLYFTQLQLYVCNRCWVHTYHYD